VIRTHYINLLNNPNVQKRSEYSNYPNDLIQIGSLKEKKKEKRKVMKRGNTYNLDFFGTLNSPTGNQQIVIPCVLVLCCSAPDAKLNELTIRYLPWHYKLHWTIINLRLKAII